MARPFRSEGLVLGLSVTDNLLLERVEHAPFAQRGMRQFTAMREHAAQVGEISRARAPGGPRTRRNA